MKARGEILKQVQDDGVITVTRFGISAALALPAKKHFPAKTPNKNLLLKVCRSRSRLKDIPKAMDLSANIFLNTRKATDLSANIFLNIPKGAELSAKRLGDIRKRSEISAKDFADNPNRIFGGFGFG